MAYTIRVWDLPTRIFHWSLVLCFIGLVVTGTLGGDAMPWHFRCGYCVLALLLFRLAWGLVGGHWSRFAQFLYSPRRVLAFWRGQGQAADSVGHNPLGALSVFAMLLFLAAQVLSGLFSDDEIAFTGPLAHMVSAATVELATHYHSAVGRFVLFGLVGIHVVAIVFYKVKKQQNLTAAMLTGDKAVGERLPSARDDAATRVLAACLFGLAVLAVRYLVSLGD